jgi:replicative DNA helicase
MNTPHTPTSTSSERTLIAAIIDGHAPDILSSDITEDWFFDNNTKAAFAAAKRLFETSSDITEISVATELNAEQSKIAVVDQSDSDHYVAGLPYGNVDGWRAAYDICRTKAFQRDMIHSTRELLEALQRPNTHVNGVVSAMEDPFAKLMNFNISDEGKSATAEIDEFIQEQMDEAAGKVEAVPHEFRLYTGMPLMEDIFEPIDVRRRDNHIVIGAPSSTGKSALMRQIIMKNLEEHDDWVIVAFLLESSKEDFWKNAARSMAGINTRKPLVKVDGRQQKKYFECLHWIKEQTDKRLFLFDDPASLSSIAAKCNKIKAKSGRLDLIAVDYIQIIERERSGNSEAEVAAISRGLQQLQKRMRCPLIDGSQLNEDGKVRESRAIFNDATRMWIMDRPERDNRGQKQEEGQDCYFQTLQQQKYRNGARATVGFNFHVDTQTMTDIK